MGVLISTRNFLPPLIGIPLMRPYLATVVEEGTAMAARGGAGPMKDRVFLLILLVALAVRCSWR
jgi:hypothetical protein